MNILFLDDDKTRHERFRQWVTDGHAITYVTTAREAILALGSQKFHIAFLDHDLGGEQMVTHTEETGYQVCLWLEENPQHCPASIVIHSLNPAGSQRMLAALRNTNCNAMQISFMAVMTNPCRL